MCTECVGDTIGQCIDDTNTCAGINATGQCPASYTICTTRYGIGALPRRYEPAVGDTWGTDIFTWRDAGGDVFDLLGSHYEIDGVETRWIPDIYGYQSPVYTSGGGDPLAVATTIDTVNCEVRFGKVKTDHHVMFTVEKAAYLRDDSTTPSLTETGLSAWCAGTGKACTPDKRWWCEDVGQSTTTTLLKTQCVLRRGHQSAYTTNNVATGGKSGSFDTFKVVVTPDCASWVSGIDPDTACQHPLLFTGCVITETDQHAASSVDDGTGYDIWNSTVYYGTYVSHSGSVANSSQECRTECGQATGCTVWQFELPDTCTVFVTTAQLSPGNFVYEENHTTGTMGGYYSYGMPVPRLHTGRTSPTPVQRGIGSLYNVNGAEFYVMESGATVPFSTSILGTVTLASGSKMVYFGTNSLDDSVDILDLDDIGVTVLDKSEVAAYEINGGKFLRTPAMVKIKFGPVEVLGMIDESKSDGFGTSVLADDNHTNGAPLGRGRGFRGVFRTGTGQLTATGTNNSELVLVLARWLYDVKGVFGQVDLPELAFRNYRRTCVPLVMRDVLDAKVLGTLATEEIVRRMDPVDCTVAGTIAHSVPVQKLFEEGGSCSGDQNLVWPDSTGVGDANNNAALVTNVRYYTNWAKVMATSTGTGYFANTEDGAVSTVNGLGWFPARPGDVTANEAVPNCKDSDPDGCSVAIDRTGFVPCTGIRTMSVPVCMSPLMVAVVPQYADVSSATPGTPSLVPFNLFGSVQSVSKLPTNNGGWEAVAWTRYSAMNHYCARYGVDQNSVPVPTDIIGWEPGYLVKCANDALATSAARLEMCTTKQPWWVTVGKVLTDLTFDDLCPFVTEGGHGQYCFVFSDGNYPTVGSFLNARLPDTLSWDSTRFYYVPYKFSAFQNVVLDLSVINTLHSNNIYAGGSIPLTKSNHDMYGPAASLMASYLATLTDTDVANLDAIANGDALTEPMIESVATIIANYYNPLSNTYTMPSLVDGVDTSSTEFAAVDIEAIFRERSTIIEYNGIILDSVGNRTVRVGNDPDIRVNDVGICTRYQINGESVQIRNVILDQTLCTYTGVFARTPIVISGLTGNHVVLDNLTVVEASAAVAILGLDDLVMRRRKSLDIDGLVISNIRFEYSLASEIEPYRRRVLAVFAAAVGVATVTECAPTPDNYTTLSNCVLLYVPVKPVVPTGCTGPQQCLNESMCCGGMLAIPDQACEFGVRCTGNVSEVDNLILSAPNTAILCNGVWCDSTPVVEDPSSCYYDMTGCEVSCGGTMTATDGPPHSPAQGWRYSPGTSKAVSSGWYPLPRYTVGTGTQDFIEGVGAGTVAWVTSVPTNGTLLPSDLSIGVGPVVPGAITIVPGAEFTTLHLNPASFFATVSTGVYSSVFLTALADTGQWCVVVENGTLVITSCTETTPWYISPGDTRLHVSGSPFLCMTEMPGSRLAHLPCLPCNIGTERPLLSDEPGDVTQLYKWDPSETDVRFGRAAPAGVVWMYTTFTAGNHYGYLINAEGHCATARPTRSGWEACVGDFMFPDVGVVCDSSTSGIFRFLCNQGYGGVLKSLVPTSTAVCVGTTVSSRTGGTGAVVTRSVDNVLEITSGGMGYLNGEIATVGGCPYTIVTTKVMIQPKSIAFDVVGSGWELINMTALSGYINEPFVISSQTENINLSVFGTIGMVLLVIIAATVATLFVALSFWKATLVRPLTKKVKLA